MVGRIGRDIENQTMVRKRRCLTDPTRLRIVIDARNRTGRLPAERSSDDSNRQCRRDSTQAEWRGVRQRVRQPDDPTAAGCTARTIALSTTAVPD